MDFELLHPADQIVMIMERIYEAHMTTTSGGNISVLDSNGDVWITPGGIDKGSLTRRDIVRVRPDGTIEGIHKPSIELPFHQSVYRCRPEVRAVVHAHPPALVAFSVVRKIPNTRLVPNARLVCGEVGMAEYDLPGSMALGEKIAAVFARGYNCVMLENHGVVTAGTDLFRAFMAFETLDFCARIESEAMRLGGNISALTDCQIELSKEEQDFMPDEFTPRFHTSEENEARREMCGLIRRACSQQLFTSTQGTFSHRLSGEAFLITPYGRDRKYLEPADLVLIDGMKREQGKTPSRSALLHRLIYQKQKHVNSVILAHPPAIMAFAVTRSRFDTKTIPESYLMLRQITRLPYGASFADPEKTALLFTEKSPVALVENDCVIATGSSLLNAFDRLEVAEFSAKAVIMARALGDMVMIGDREIADIDRAFNL